MGGSGRPYDSYEAQERDVRYDFVGYALVTLGILLLFSGVRGGGGVVPVGLVRVLQYLVGAGAYVIPVVSIFAGASVVAHRETCSFRVLGRSLALLFFVFISAYHLRVPAGSEFEPSVFEEYGGLVGGVGAMILRKFFGDVGGYVVLSAVALVAFALMGDSSVREMPRDFLEGLIPVFEFLARLVSRAHRRRGGVRRLPQQRPSRPVVERTESAPTLGKVEIAEDPEKTSLRTEASSASPEKATRAAKARPRKSSAAAQLDLFPAGASLPSHYQTCLNSLDPPMPTDTKDSKADSEAGVKLVEDTLASFRIEAKVTQVKKGPVVTRYEVQPAPGIRVNRITNLADDLALALAAIDVRVEAPVPGKSVIGIEVPNKRVALVRLREIVELNEFIAAPSKLTFALGKDIAGNPMFADLAKMPHLLIAGATNSGKSVCLNSIITSILCRADPDEVKLSLIDPKRVELTLYKDIPHLFHPVVVDAQGAVRALRGAIREMERRYKLFAEKGVRNISSYNSRLDEGEKPLYFIMVVIDELADLMMQAAAEFERLICRIAQLARATGIHLIIATQRPSVNVITGVIKANISSRIAFAVASQVDSRTILDVNGAERLIGQGDMLYHPIDSPKPVRIQGAYLSEDEVNRVVDILVQQNVAPKKFELDLEAVEEEIQAEHKAKSEEKDDLFDQALSLVRRRRQASASMLQREFEIGYPRAGRLIDQLEQAGYVGPQEGSKPRDVLTGDLEGDIVGEAVQVGVV